MGGRLFWAGEVLLDEGLIKGVQGARGVCDEGSERVYEHVFIAAIPLQPPRMAISQEGNLVNSGAGWIWCVQGVLLYGIWFARGLWVRFGPARGCRH